MQQTQPQCFDYRVSQAAVSAFPGMHVGRMSGEGQLFKQHQQLIARPDPRRLDLRASVLDPWQQYKVKVFQQRSQLSVFLLTDCSGSMQFAGGIDKKAVLTDALLSVAQSVWQAGDRFGFIAAHQDIEREVLLIPATQNQGRIQQIAQKLASLTLQPGIQGMQKAVDYLPGQSSLVFILSDFHWPLPFLDSLLQRLNAHQVVPLVLWDEKEYAQLPQWGALRLRDLESQATRTLFLRPGLKQQISDNFAARKKSLIARFRAFGCEPLFLQQGFHAEQLTAYFNAGCGCPAA